MSQREKLRVCLDARKFGDGGIGVYIRNAIYGLLHQNVSLTLLTNEGQTLPTDLTVRFLENVIVDNGTLQQPSASTLSDFRVEVVKAKPFSLQELFSLRHEVDWSQFDLFHTPNYVLPYGITCPSVITVHDLIHLVHPEKPFYPLVAGPLIYSSLSRAAHVISVSKATKTDLERIYRFPLNLKEKLSVVPNALCRSFLGKKKNQELLRTHFHLTRPFFLCVLSNVKPHKGVSDLLSAFRELVNSQEKKKQREFELVLVGQGTESLPALEQILPSSDDLKNVRLLGSVSQEELFQLYSFARALVVPSFREGFCLPVIEAQAVGTPVITRPIPAVLENISPRDIICTDFSQEALLTGLKRFLQLEERCGEYSAQLESWQKSFLSRVDPLLLGEKLLSVYNRAAGFRESTSEDSTEGVTQREKLSARLDQRDVA